MLKIGLDFVVPTCVVWVKNTDSVVSRSMRRSHELRTKLAARSPAFHSNLFIAHLPVPTYVLFPATSADDSIHIVPK
ncbi:hypothetical protein J6590_085363 [Homalodisca vitripennis]|nr:hypothetical protein J6590_085363 [Homalodisca vitripennis]